MHIIEVPVHNCRAAGSLQSTYTLAAVDTDGNVAGAVTASRYIAVGSLTIHAAAQAGVVVTQSVADPFHAKLSLPRLAAGEDPEIIMQELIAADPTPLIRQIGLLRWDGRGAVYSGSQCTPAFGEVRDEGIIAMGNMLSNDLVLPAMVKTFLSLKDTLEPGKTVRHRCNNMARVLLGALEAGEQTGGDKRGKQAAALLVVAPRGGYGGRDDRAIDLRVDDHPRPVTELKRIFRVFLDNQRREFAE